MSASADDDVVPVVETEPEQVEPSIKKRRVETADNDAVPMAVQPQVAAAPAAAAAVEAQPAMTGAPDPRNRMLQPLPYQDILNLAMARSQGDKLSPGKLFTVVSETAFTRCAPFPILTSVGLRMGFAVISTEYYPGPQSIGTKLQPIVPGATTLVPWGLSTLFETDPAGQVFSGAARTLVGQVLAALSPKQNTVYFDLLSARLDPVSRKFLHDDTVSISGDSWGCAFMLCCAGGTLIPSSGAFSALSLLTAAPDPITVPMDEYVKKAALCMFAGLPGLIVCLRPDQVDASQEIATAVKASVQGAKNLFTIDLPSMIFYDKVTADPSNFFLFPAYTVTEAISGAAFLTFMLNRIVSGGGSGAGSVITADTQKALAKAKDGAGVLAVADSQDNLKALAAKYVELKKAIYKYDGVILPTSGQPYLPPATKKNVDDLVENIEVKKRLANLPGSVKTMENILNAILEKERRYQKHVTQQAEEKAKAASSVKVSAKKAPTFVAKSSMPQSAAADRLAALLKL